MQSDCRMEKRQACLAACFNGWETDTLAQLVMRNTQTQWHKCGIMLHSAMCICSQQDVDAQAASCRHAYWGLQTTRQAAVLGWAGLLSFGGYQGMLLKKMVSQC